MKFLTILDSELFRNRRYLKLYGFNTCGNRKLYKNKTESESFVIGVGGKSMFYKYELRSRYLFIDR